MTDYQLCQLIHFYGNTLGVENEYLEDGYLDDRAIEIQFEALADREDWIGVAIFSELAKRTQQQRIALWNVGWKSAPVPVL